MFQCPAIRPVCVDLVDWVKSQSAVQSLGHIDLLVNNAGVIEIKPFLEVTADSFDWQAAVHMILTSQTLSISYLAQNYLSHWDRL